MYDLQLSFAQFCPIGTRNYQNLSFFYPKFNKMLSTFRLKIQNFMQIQAINNFLEPHICRNKTKFHKIILAQNALFLPNLTNVSSFLVLNCPSKLTLC